MLLLCRSPLLPGESLPSLIIRLATLNRYDPPSMLDQICGACFSRSWFGHPTEPAVFQLLADLTGIDPMLLYHASRHHFAAILTPPGGKIGVLPLPDGETAPLLYSRTTGLQLHPDTAVQFCPHCLEEVAYHRLTWLPIAVAACLKHRCLLLQGCPQCHCPLSIREIVTTCCQHCGMDLKQASPHSLENDPVGLLSQQIIQNWLTCSETAGIEGLKLPEHPPQALYHLIDGFHLSVLRAKSDWEYLHRGNFAQPVFPDSHIVTRRIAPPERYLAFATAFKVITNWPTGFYEFLQAYRCRNGEYLNRDIKTDLGDLYYTWLQKRWLHPAFQFVQDAFNQYLIEHYPRSMTVFRSRRYWSNRKLARQFTFMPVPEATRLLNAISGHVCELIRCGKLTPYEAQGKNETLPLLKRSEVLAIGRQEGSLLSVVQTAQQLGVSPQVIMDMASLDLLEIEPVPESDEWLVTQKSVNYCLWRLTNRIYDAVLKYPGTPINLAMVVKMVSGLGLTEADIFKSILDKQLKSYCCESPLQNLSKLIFAKASVTAYIRKIQVQKQTLLPGKRDDLN